MFRGFVSGHLGGITSNSTTQTSALSTPTLYSLHTKLHTLHTKHYIACGEHVPDILAYHFQQQPHYTGWNGLWIVLEEVSSERG